MLPIILFILVAYTLYGVLLWWCRWQRSRFRGRWPQGRRRWQLQGASALVLGVFLLSLQWLTPHPRDAELKLAHVLGLSSEAQPSKAAEAVPAPLGAKPAELKGKNGEPAYVLLHPAAPPFLGPPLKSSAPALRRKPKALAAKKPGASSPAPPGKREKAVSPPKPNALKKKPQHSSFKTFSRVPGWLAEQEPGLTPCAWRS